MSEATPLVRALRVLEVVQDHPGVTAARLAEDLGVSERAVRRHVASLREAGVISRKTPVKLLANGEVAQAVTVRGLKMSASARQKIEAAGGRVEE